MLAVRLLCPLQASSVDRVLWIVVLPELLLQIVYVDKEPKNSCAGTACSLRAVLRLELSSPVFSWSSARAQTVRPILLPWTCRSWSVFIWLLPDLCCLCNSWPTSMLCFRRPRQCPSPGSSWKPGHLAVYLILHLVVPCTTVGLLNTANLVVGLPLSHLFIFFNSY